MKNVSQNTSRKIYGGLDTYLQKGTPRPEKTHRKKKNTRRAGKIDETWVGTKPKTPRPSHEAEKKKIIKEKYEIKLSHRKGSVTTGFYSHKTAYTQILIPLCTY